MKNPMISKSRLICAVSGIILAASHLPAMADPDDQTDNTYSVTTSDGTADVPYSLPEPADPFVVNPDPIGLIPDPAAPDPDPTEPAPELIITAAPEPIITAAPDPAPSCTIEWQPVFLIDIPVVSCEPSPVPHDFTQPDAPENESPSPEVAP